MKTIDYYLGAKGRIEEELNIFFQKKNEQMKNNCELAEFSEIIGDLETFVMSAGKRMRPILFYFGYVLAGGKEKEEALKTSIAVELLHSYFLIHDDIIDKADFRHGELSMHYKYIDEAEKNLKNVDSKHFGVSKAILVGDLMLALSCEVLNNSNFDCKAKERAMTYFNNIICNTIYGQLMDLNLDGNEGLEVDRIFKMQKYKTAKYTVEGPMQLGAILANADKKYLDCISTFSIPIGIAFQMQDDIMGVFGDKAKIGKPVGSDIQEGKRTYLIVEAERKANGKQRKTLSRAQGNANLTLEELEEVRKIIKDTGALKKSQDTANKLVETAKKNIKCLSREEKYIKVSNDLANFVVKRDI